MSPKLSVGIMVKNQAKELRECLERLADTRAKISTEIIVHVDDSTTEDTYAVAKEFTDRVEYFKWIDNYSVIKNGIMEQATGDWIWILDADEFACDTMPLIDFINSEEAKSYSLAQYFEKNYFDKMRKRFSLQHAIRVYKRSDNHRYINAVHEVVQVAGRAIKSLDMYVDHIGYVGYLKSEKRKIRTLAVKKEYEENPNDIRVAILYADSFSPTLAKEVQERIKVLKKALLLSRKGEPTNYDGVVYFKLVEIYCEQGKIKEAKEVLFEYKKRTKIANYSLGEIYCLFAKHFFEEKNYEEAVVYFSSYFKVYEKVQNGTISEIDRDIDYYSQLLSNCDNVKDNMARYSISLAKTGQIKEAKKQLENKEFMEYDGEEALKAYLVISQEAENPSFLTDLYLAAAQAQNSERLEHIRNATEFMFAKPDIEKIDYVMMESLAALIDKLPEDIYIKFNLLRTNGSFDGVEDVLQELAELSDAWTRCVFGFILNRILKDKIPLSLVAKGAAVNKLALAAGLARQFNDEYQSLLGEYLEIFDKSENLQELRIKKELVAVVVRNAVEPGGMSIEFFKVCIGIMGEYTTKVVPIELMEGENSYCLSNELQMGLKMYKLCEAKNKGDMLTYVRHLKEIIKLDQSMADSVSILLEEVSGQLEQDSKVNNEMDTLTQGVKAILFQFIEKKDKANATIIFKQLQSIVPNDKDLEQLLIKINNI